MPLSHSFAFLTSQSFRLFAIPLMLSVISHFASHVPLLSSTPRRQANLHSRIICTCLIIIFTAFSLSLSLFRFASPHSLLNFPLSSPILSSLHLQPVWTKKGERERENHGAKEEEEEEEVKRQKEESESK